MTQLRAVELNRVWRTLRHVGTRRLLQRVLRRVGQRVWRFVGPKHPALWVLGVRREQLCCEWSARGGIPILPETSEPRGAWEGVKSGRFAAMGVVGPIADWRGEGMPYLWGLKLHYFEYLDALRGAAREGTGKHPEADAVELMRTWIDLNPVASEPGWHPYAVAERLISWMALFRELGVRPPPDVFRSIVEQSAYLRRCIEWDLSNNHVVVQLCGLLVALSAFERSPRVTARRNWAARRLRQVLDKLLSPEGVLRERSSGYHALVLWKLWTTMALDRELGKDFPDIATAVRRMWGALPALAGPDGVWLPLHDSIPGWAPPLSAFPEGGEHVPLRVGDAREGLGAVDLRESAFEVVMDVGEPAPACNPAHTHCSIGQVLVWLGGNAVIVDPGSSTYSGRRRREERSAELHNAPVVDRSEQSEIWGDFRLGGRARITACERTEARCRVEYLSWDGAVRAERELELSTGRLTVRDRVLSKNSGEVAVLLTFGPLVRVGSVQSGSDRCCLDVTGTTLYLTWHTEGGRVDAVALEMAERMGKRRRVEGLRMSARMQNAWEHCWSLSTSLDG